MHYKSLYNTTKIMESINNSNSFVKNEQIITLKGYYLNLPDSTHPKTEFINEVIKRTGVSFTTARNWVIYGMKPNNPEHVKALVEITGIPAANLWND